MQKESFFSAKNLTALAILLALVVVLQAVGGSFSIGAITLNFTLIPIVLGAMLLGKGAGGFLGFASGVVVLIQVIIAPAGLYFIMWTNSPIITTLICLVKTTVAGWVCGLVFDLFKKKERKIGVFLSAGLVPVINTGLFIIGCIAMWDTIALAAEGKNVLAFIFVGLVGLNFFVELAVNLLVAPAIHTVYGVVEKQFRRKK